MKKTPIRNKVIVMSKISKVFAFMFSLMTLAGLSYAAFAHMPVPRKSEVQEVPARLFAADAATGEIIAIDLPGGDTVVRLPTPPFIMTMGLSGDQKHLFVMRGRTTDRDWVTVIDTGFDPDTDEIRPPHFARTFLGFNTGGTSDGKMLTVGGKDAVFLEGEGEIIVFEGNDFTGLGEVPTRRYKLAAPAHYHYLEAGENLYFGHLALGFVQVLNRESGAEIARISDCPEVHGRFHDEPSGRLFYACLEEMMVIGTRGAETNKIVTRFSYPQSMRAGSFLKGKDRVYWGFTMGTLPILYRLDVAREPYSMETLPVNASVQQGISEDGSFLLSLSRESVLEIRDGGSGELLRTVTVGGPLKDTPMEMLDRAILSDILTVGSRAFISLPHEGRIAEVDLEKSEVIRYLEVGGRPTKLVLAQASDYER